MDQSRPSLNQQSYFLELLNSTDWGWHIDSDVRWQVAEYITLGQYKRMLALIFSHQDAEASKFFEELRTKAPQSNRLPGKGNQTL